MITKKEGTQLSEKAMLVKLNISVWTGRKKDRTVTNEIIDNKHAYGDAGAWWTYLVPRKEMRRVHIAEDKCRTIWRECTLPWDDAGSRILSSKMFLEYNKRMRKAVEEFHEAVEEFIADYPNIAQNAKTRLGELAKTNKLPTASEIRNKFNFAQHIMPMPVATDFRVSLSEADVDAVREQIEADVNNAMKKAMTDIWVRLSDLVSKLEQTLKKPDKIFRDTLITNIGQFCKIMPKLNIMDDANINNIHKEVMEQLAKLKPETLRTNKRARRNTAKKAKDIMKKMEVYMK